MSETLVTLLVLYALYKLRILDMIVLSPIVPIAVLMLAYQYLGGFWDWFTGAGRVERAKDD